MSGSAPLEIERKYLIRRPDEAILSAQEGASRVVITQTYLTPDGDGSRRIRRWEDENGVKYIMTRKKRVTDLTRIELETELTEEQYRSLLSEADPERSSLHKIRWRIPYLGQCVEIDLYPFWKNQASLEIEMESEDQSVLLPPYIELIREVTGIRGYENASLSKLLKSCGGNVPENL